MPHWLSFVSMNVCDKMPYYIYYQQVAMIGKLVLARHDERVHSPDRIDLTKYVIDKQLDYVSNVCVLLRSRKHTPDAHMHFPTDT